eukprot:18710_1
MSDTVIIIKQDWISKKSRHLGLWRRRWTVLTANKLTTYKTQNQTEATESIPLSTVNTVKSINNTILSIQCGNEYRLRTDTETEKLEWIDAITACSQTCVEIPIMYGCPRDDDYKGYFPVSVPYHMDYAYSVKTLIKDIITLINKRYHPFKFIAIKIESGSFIGQELYHDNYDWRNLDANITDYRIDELQQSGLQLVIDMDIYRHNIVHDKNACTDTSGDNNLCSTYMEVKEYYIFSEQHLNHLHEFTHPYTTVCRWGDECYAFKRVEKGGNDLKDRCHIMVFKHPPRDLHKEMKDGINSFCLNDEWYENIPLYHPTDEDKKESAHNADDGFLKLLIKEVVDNGWKNDLCLTEEDAESDDYTLLNLVDEKLNCMRHRLMGKPLNRAEMLSLLLYTGGWCNYFLCKSQRDGDYNQWKWLDYCLHNAIHRLSKREHGSYKIYTGLQSTQLSDRFVESGYFKTYVSTSWVKDLALNFVDNNGMMFEIGEEFRENAICCDVSWISKYGTNECEVLIARSIDAVLNSFECEIIDVHD